jgi:hypothetical protein
MHIDYFHLLKTYLICMVFHLMSWLMHTGREGNYFFSDPASVTEDGCEVLTTKPQHAQVV